MKSEKCKTIIEIKREVHKANGERQCGFAPAQELRRMNAAKPQSGPGQSQAIAPYPAPDPSSQIQDPARANPSPLLFPFNLQHFALWPSSLRGCARKAIQRRRDERWIVQIDKRPAEQKMAKKIVCENETDCREGQLEKGKLMQPNKQ